MIRRPYFLLMIGLFAGTSLWAVAQPTPEEIEQRRRQLEALRKHPDQVARLRQDLQLFLNLPDNRRNAIVKLDRDLHEVAPKKQLRLLSVLERYADWLEALSQKNPQAHQAIKNAPDASTRLALIKEQRDREAMEQQPKAYRDQWEKLQGEERAEFVAKVRRAARQKQQQWLLAQRFWRELEGKQQRMPARLSDFGNVKDKKGNEANKVKEYFNDYLLPYLSIDEKNQLANVEGRWPEYPQALVAIARKRPSALPPRRKEDLPVHFAQLPHPIQVRLSEKKAGGKKKMLQELKKFDGRPEFPSKVLEILEIGTKKARFEFEYWASYRHSLEPPMVEFVTKQLTPRLDTRDKADLEHFEGKWPYYPQTIQELSDKHNLSPPWHILPEPEKWKWDLYRKPLCQSWGWEAAKEKKGP